MTLSVNGVTAATDSMSTASTDTMSTTIFAASTIRAILRSRAVHTGSRIIAAARLDMSPGLDGAIRVIRGL
jgi:hypothetical protein